MTDTNNPGVEALREGEAVAAAVAFERMHPSLELCVQFSEDGQHIRRWSRLPFEGGTDFYSHPAQSHEGAAISPDEGVTQADRIAAVDIHNVILHDWHTQHMLDGMEDECYVIQAFRRHRLATSDAASVSVETAAGYADYISEQHRQRANEAEARIAAALSMMPSVGEGWQEYALRLRMALAAPPSIQTQGEGDKGNG